MNEPVRKRTMSNYKFIVCDFNRLFPSLISDNSTVYNNVIVNYLHFWVISTLSLYYHKITDSELYNKDM